MDFDLNRMRYAEELQARETASPPSPSKALIDISSRLGANHSPNISTTSSSADHTVVHMNRPGMKDVAWVEEAASELGRWQFSNANDEVSDETNGPLEVTHNPLDFWMQSGTLKHKNSDEDQWHEYKTGERERNTREWRMNGGVLKRKDSEESWWREFKAQHWNKGDDDFVHDDDSVLDDDPVLDDDSELDVVVDEAPVRFSMRPNSPTRSYILIMVERIHVEVIEQTPEPPRRLRRETRRI